MKKYFWTLSVMALFAIGFAASDDDDSSNGSSSSSSQTEQKQETEAERQEREKAKMEKELAGYAREEAHAIATYSYSPEKGQPIPKDVRDSQCQRAFLRVLKEHPNFGADDNMQLYGEFKKAWDEEYDKVEAAKRAMENF